MAVTLSNCCVKKTTSLLAAAGVCAMLASAPLAAADGAAVFNAVCNMCHGSGVGGAPKLGDKAAWQPRIAKGVATLEEHAINGFKDKGVMPPRGGKASLSDADVKAAVAYMVDAAK
ncbi:MAG: nosC [Gammaproteobacteria bacterium]|nr:MAG: nosC [Gammaproteobacteria bacterium]TND01972.1 MAG: nosC [Gammaproteobacteria bacterium]